MDTQYSILSIKKSSYRYLSFSIQLFQLAETTANLKSTQDKLAQVTNKMSDFRNQANSLKQEVKVLHKVLNSEVGEGVNIQELLNAPSGYRGRAQQILLMQKKVCVKILHLVNICDVIKQLSLNLETF